jgi:hypothetical protein
MTVYHGGWHDCLLFSGLVVLDLHAELSITDGRGATIRRFGASWMDVGEA